MKYHRLAAIILSALLLSGQQGAQAQTMEIEIARFGNSDGGVYQSCGASEIARGIRFDLSHGVPNRLTLTCNLTTGNGRRARCPGGLALTGLIARDDGLLSSINWIRCTDPQTRRHRLLRPSEWYPIGNGKVRRIECPARWQISAIRSRSVKDTSKAASNRLAVSIFCRAPADQTD